jgi:hypothetical protein
MSCCDNAAPGLIFREDVNSCVRHPSTCLDTSIRLRLGSRAGALLDTGCHFHCAQVTLNTVRVLVLFQTIHRRFAAPLKASARLDLLLLGSFSVTRVWKRQVRVACLRRQSQHTESASSWETVPLLSLRQLLEPCSRKSSLSSCKSKGMQQHPLITLAQDPHTWRSQIAEMSPSDDDVPLQMGAGLCPTCLCSIMCHRQLGCSRRGVRCSKYKRS